MPSPLVLDPADAVLSALLRLDLATVRAVLSDLEPGDLADPHHLSLRALIGQLADEGITPDPAAVYAHAATTGLGEHKLRQLALRLADLYRANPAPESVWHYHRAVLDTALRRRARAAATRLRHAAEHGDHDSILTAALTTATEIDRLHERITAATHRQEAYRLAPITHGSTESPATAVSTPNDTAATNAPAPPITDTGGARLGPAAANTEPRDSKEIAA